MIALLTRNIKIYFSNIPGVIMSCLGALISFLIYIGFLEQNLLNQWESIPNATVMLDLWMIAGIVSIAGITTSFQALGQYVKDRESRTNDDLKLTDLSLVQQNFAYVLSSSLISFVMQIVTFLVMIVYFQMVDKVSLPSHLFPKILIFMLLGAVGATMANELIIIFIHSATTFSRLSAVIGAAAGFAVATYMPYGTLSQPAQSLVKWIPSSYEAASLRELLLNQISKNDLTVTARQQLSSYLGIHYQLFDQRLTLFDNALVILGMIIALVGGIIILSAVIDRKREKNWKFNFIKSQP